MLGDPIRASVLWGTTERLRQELEACQSPTFKARNDATVAAVLAKVDAEEFDRAWQSGRAMPLDQAIDYALEGLDA